MIFFFQARNKWKKVLSHIPQEMYVVDQWLWKCNIISKMQTVSNTLYTVHIIGQKQRVCFVLFETFGRTPSSAQMQLDKNILLYVIFITKHIYYLLKHSAMSTGIGLKFRAALLCGTSASSDLF